MRLAFAHHQDVLNTGGERKPGAIGIHTAAENITLHVRNAVDVFDYLAPLRNLCSIPAAVRIALYQKVTHKKYYGWAEPSLSRGYGRQIAEKLRRSRANVLLCTEVKHAAFVPGELPVAVWTDSLYGGLFDYYETFSGLCSHTVKDMQAMDHAAVERCERLIFASEWAARRAIELYGASEEQVKVVPYGANLAAGFDRTEAERLIHEKRFEGPCRLLFAGVEWRRKGGDTAIRIAEHLQSQGIPVELTVLGTDPAGHMKQIPDFVKSAGFLSPAKPDELAAMRRLYQEAHFLLLPCRAECFGHIFPEANSFALPVIASNTGGIPTAVHENINGFCFEPERAHDYANCIARLFGDPDEYRALSLRAFDDYTNRLSWDAAANRVVQILDELSD